MKTKFLFIAILCVFISLVTLSSCGQESPCSDEEPSKHTEYFVSEEYKNKIPYSGTDTLVFISDENDTAVLYGKGKKVFMDKESKNRNSNPDCPFYDYSYFESIEFIFGGTNILLSRIGGKYYTNGDFQYCAFYINWGLEGIATLSNVNNEAFYMDTVIINGLTYKVCGLDRGANDTASTFFYNSQKGILKIELPNGKTWLRNL